MNIEQQVDLILDRKDDSRPKRNHKQFWFTLGSFLVAFMLGTMLFLPLVSRFETDEIEIESIDDNVASSGSNMVWHDEGGVWNYWTVQGNSFGVTSGRELNDTFIENFIDEHLLTQLNASVTGDDGTWVNASEGLTTNINWNATNNSAKITWIINTTTAPTSLYYRLTFAIDERCTNYINGSGIDNHSVQFDIPFGNESASFVFNWSDIIPLINSGRVYVRRGRTTIGNNSYFWFRVFSTDKINPDVVFEIDPNFGNEGKSFVTACGNGIHASYASPATSGTLKNITVYYQGVICRHACAIYEYLGADSIGDLIAYSEEKTIGTGWTTYNISSEPSIAVTNYFLAFWSEDVGGTENIGCISGGSGGDWEDITYNHPTWTDPFNREGGWGNTFSIYASYTESSANTAPTITGEVPANQSTGISLTPICNVTANDVDGDNLNVTFWENTSGSYVMRQKNSSVSANTSVVWDNYSNAHTGSTMYWWRVYVDDGTGNVSETYYFTTAANETRTPTQVFNYWWSCGNETTRSPTQVFNYWWQCSNTSYRTPTQIFDYWWLCGNTSARSPTQLFDYWWFCSNVSEVRTPTQVFNYWWSCGNTSSRTPMQVFDYWWLCGNTSSRQPTNIFDYWWLCGNTSGRNPTQVFDYWWQCSNTSYRTPTQVFDYWWRCGNGTERSPTQVFDYWWLCGNVTAEVRSPTQVFDYWWQCGNWTRTPTQVFDYWWQCGNWTRTPTQVFNYWWQCGNTSLAFAIIDEYPENLSNIYATQPTLYFTLTHPDSNVMNYTIYTGNSSINCTSVLASAVNVSAGTHHYVNYFNATEFYTDYYFAVHANDGTSWVNETYNFSVVRQSSNIIGGGGGAIAMGIAGGLLGALIILVILYKRRKEDEY